MGGSVEEAASLLDQPVFVIPGVCIAALAVELMQVRRIVLELRVIVKKRVKLDAVKRQYTLTAEVPGNCLLISLDFGRYRARLIYCRIAAPGTSANNYADGHQREKTSRRYPYSPSILVFDHDARLTIGLS